MAAIPEIQPEVLSRSLRVLSPVVHRYFRSETRRLDRVPDGPTILVTSHDGGVLPINGICFGVHWYEHFGFQRPFYVLTHDLLHTLIGRFTTVLSDSGLVPADREYLNGVLERGYSVLIFPGAARESFRTFKDRREVDLGGRRGFVSAAIRWNVPITPVASAGAHETLFVLSGGHRIARALGIPRIVRSGDVLPVVAGIPWGVWFLPMIPQFPLPAKIVNEVLEPIYPSRVIGRPLTPDDAEDPDIVLPIFEAVLEPIRAATRRLYDERRFPVLG